MKSYITMLIGFLVLLFMWNSYYIVSPGHIGVAVFLGKVDTHARPEGFGLKSVLTSVKNIPIKQITAQDKTICFTSDMQQIDVQYTVMYRIPGDKAVILFQQYSGLPYDTLIKPRVEERVKQATAQYRAEQIVQQREKIRMIVIDAVKDAIGEIINIVDVNLTNIDFTDALEKAIEIKVIEEQKALAKTFELEKAKKDADIKRAIAQGEADAMWIKGDALSKNPLLTFLEAIQKWDGKAPATLVIDGKTTNMLPIK